MSEEDITNLEKFIKENISKYNPETAQKLNIFVKSA